ncbi:MAG: hypothetical protein FWD99_00810 [Oscillospiraceae bacterium]|nr:hypothetical protein [Oscillospiraceae bacterium]
MQTKKVRKKLFIGCIIVAALLYIAFFMPLPFIPSLWEENALRHRMAGDISRRVIGLHEEKIILMLGEPEPNWTTFVYRLRNPVHSHSWRHLIIFFDEDGIATRTGNGNLFHWGEFRIE